MSENINNEEMQNHVDSGTFFKPPGELNLIGNVSQNYKEFEKSFKIYMVATGFNKLEEEDKKISILLNIIGEDAVRIYEAHQLQGETLEEVLSNFRNYFEPKKPTILCRYRFLSTRQEEQETIETYVTRLKALAEPCDFGDQTEPLLRDKLVLGIRNKKLQEQLLSKIELTLKEAVEICHTWETGESLMKEISSNEDTDGQGLKEESSNKNHIKKVKVKGRKLNLNNNTGQLNFELEQHPEFQLLFQKYLGKKLSNYKEMSRRKNENREQELQSSEIKALENIFRQMSVNSSCKLDQDTDSEGKESETSDENFEEDCENLVSFLAPQIEGLASASKNSVCKSPSKVTLPAEKDGPDLKSSTQEATEGRPHAPMNFKSNTGILTCSACQWIPPDRSFETFLAHCKTTAHKIKLIERFPESQTQGVKVESKVHMNNEKQKDSLSKVNFYSKVTGIHLDDSQRQNSARNAPECEKTLQYLKLPEQPLPQQFVKQEVQKVEKVKKKKKKKKQKQEQTVLNSAEESKINVVPNSESKKQASQSGKQNAQQDTKDKMINTLNLKIFALSKGMSCIQAPSENSLCCETCKKQIPSSSNFDALTRNVMMHLQSKKHLKKLLKAEDSWKSLLSKNLVPGESNSLDNKNSKKDTVEGNKVLSKKINSSKDQSLSASKTLVQEKTVLESKKPNQKEVAVKTQNAALKQEKGKTDDSGVKFLCLQCNFSNYIFEEFGRHLESERHSNTPNGIPRAQNPECTECNYCNTFLFGSLFEINLHFSKCLNKKE